MNDLSDFGKLRRKLLKFLGAFAIAPTILKASAGRSQKQPNVIIFLSDDQRWDSLGFEGNELALTPNLDHLANVGTAFRNSFVTTPICASSRATIFTGLHFSAHKFNFGTAGIDPSLTDTTFPFLLRQNGYKTGLVGKLGVWWDDGNWAALKRKLGFGGSQAERLFDFLRPVGRSPYIVKDEYGKTIHSLDQVAKHSTEFLAAQNSSDPFCLIVSFNAPHITEPFEDQRRFQPAATEEALLADETMPKSNLDRADLRNDLPDFLTQGYIGKQYEQLWSTKEARKQGLDYYRLVAGVDRVFGEVLAVLDDQGLRDDTVVFFTSDNGYSHGERQLGGKWTHFDESIRVPMIIHDPREASAGLERPQEFALNIDIPSTVLDLCNVPIPKSYQGESLRPFLSDTIPTKWRSEFFCEHYADIGLELPDWVGIRGTDFMFADYTDSHGTGVFYNDLIADPWQQENLAGYKGNFEIVTKLQERTHKLKTQYSSTSPGISE